MSDADDAGDEPDAGEESGSDGASADGWMATADMPVSIQGDLRSRIPFRRRRGMKRFSRYIAETRG